MKCDREAHVLQLIGALLEEARRLVIADAGSSLRPSQYRVIGSVPADGAITVTDLAERVGMTKQAIGQFVTQLTRDGYLTTATDPADRRVRLVRRTLLGQAATDHLAEMLRALEADWARRVGTGRYRRFRAALEDLALGID